MPPLLPQPSDLCHFLDNNSTHTPPLLQIPFPDGIAHRSDEILNWKAVSSWYSGSSESVYFDLFFTDSMLQRLKIIIKPDLSDVSLQVVNRSKIISNDFMKSLETNKICDGYMICDNALVYFWDDHNLNG